jgi:hypothetical protein
MAFQQPALDLRPTSRQQTVNVTIGLEKVENPVDNYFALRPIYPETNIENLLHPLPCLN